MVALYEGFRAHNTSTTVQDVRVAALHLVNQFPAALRRSGGLRENPSLGVIPGPGSSAPETVSEETAMRIARALEAIVALYAGVHGQQNPLEGDDDDDDDDDDNNNNNNNNNPGASQT